jgi:hypothetical protein
MESINTELTPAVIAKAVQSLITALNLKVRLVLIMSFRKRRTILTYLQMRRRSLMHFMCLKIFLKQRYLSYDAGLILRDIED